MALPMGGGGSAQRPGHGHWPAASLLGGLSEEPREQMIRLGRRVRFERGERLLREGEHGSYVFLLLSGWYKVLARTPDDREALLAVRAGGDLVGELACFDAQPRVATVVAAGRGSAKLIGRQQFLDFLAAYEESAQAVMCAVAGKLRWATRRRQDFGSCPVGTRVARVLLELARAYGRPCATGVSIGVSLTQPELAELVGASEPSVHRVLRSLRERGVVETGYRRVLVKDLPELTIAADGDAAQRIVPASNSHRVAATTIAPTQARARLV
ncbi:Crp/Fnr family transcriptional regulator [Streptomyces avermitilis]|uniref:Crp/Fnr family transcriptional regulator n=1 Tax=Streptomyces avermitilis TaxID=33903 RepID=UPI0036CC007A